MKKRITLEDLAQLTEPQRHRLVELWRPEKYDLVVAYICKDVENEEYEKYEFVVGGIEIDNYAHMYLHDIAAAEGIPSEAEPCCTDSADAEQGLLSPFDSSGEEDIDEDSDEADIDFGVSRPSYFNKEECLPLFNIGQMIELLERNNFGNGDFYITASTGEIGCELGKNASSWENYGQGDESKELCDVLWELVKGIL